MTPIPYLCRIPTTWTVSGDFDEGAYREYLQRFIGPDIGVLMATPGTGARVLTMDQLLRVYKTGVQVCKGKIFVGASGIEEGTATQAIARARVAVEAKVDMVGIYGPAGFHGYRPTEDEYLAYWDRVLSEIRYPVGLGPNLDALGYLISPSLITKICRKYRQVQAVVLTGVSDDMYFWELKSLLSPDVEIYVPWAHSLETLAAGATGLAGFAAAMLPNTMRSYLNFYQARDLDGASRCYWDLRRYESFCSRNWGIPRSEHLGMRAFRLPGGEGPMPEPYILPGDEELRRYVDGVLKLDIPEINEMARSVGLLGEQ